MPKNTFHKLKAEKKDRFIQVALEEFASKNYENASINHIVSKAKIAKGSFYQYFEDKKDLFFYLMEYVNQKKQAAMALVFRQSFEDFFDMFGQMYLAGTQYDLANPLYSQFLHNVSQERNSAELGNLAQVTKKQGVEYFKRLLRQEQEKGNIRTDIDLDLMAFFVVQLGNGVPDFLDLKYQIHQDPTEESPKKAQCIAALPEFIESLVKLMRQGISSDHKNS